MAELSPHDQDRARFHLGYSCWFNIPAQDVAQFLEAVTTIPNDWTKVMVTKQLDRCDEAFDKSEMTEEPAVYKAIYAGDINRSEARFDIAQAGRRWWQNYLHETQILAMILHVPNYWMEENWRYRVERNGAEFIEAIPGVADTAIGANMYTYSTFGGGFGWSLG